MAKRKRIGSSATDIIGGAMVDLEYRIFRSVPRVEILVERGKDESGVAGDGTTLTIDVPDAPVVVRDAGDHRPE